MSGLRVTSEASRSRSRAVRTADSVRTQERSCVFGARREGSGATCGRSAPGGTRKTFLFIPVPFTNFLVLATGRLRRGSARLREETPQRRSEARSEEAPTAARRPIRAPSTKRRPQGGATKGETSGSPPTINSFFAC